MIEVVTFTKDWRKIDQAEVDEPEAAPLAMHTLWTDSQEHHTGVRRAGVYVNGKLVRLFEHKADICEYL